MGKVNGQGSQPDQRLINQDGGAGTPPSSPGLFSKAINYFGRMISSSPSETSSSPEAKADIGLLRKSESNAGFAGEYHFGDGKPLRNRKSMSPRMQQLQKMADERDAQLGKEKHPDRSAESERLMKMGDISASERAAGGPDSLSARSYLLESIVDMATGFRHRQDDREKRLPGAYMKLMTGKMTAEELCALDPSRENQVLLFGKKRIQTMQAERKDLEARIVEARNHVGSSSDSIASELETRLEALNTEIARSSYELYIKAESLILADFRKDYESTKQDIADGVVTGPDLEEAKKNLAQREQAITSLGHHIKFMKASLAASGAMGMAGMLGNIDQRIAELESELEKLEMLDTSVSTGLDKDVQAYKRDSLQRMKNGRQKRRLKLLTAELAALRSERNELSPAWQESRDELSAAHSSMHNELSKAVADRNKRVKKGSYQMRDHRSTLDAGNNDYTDSLAANVRTQGLDALDQHDKRVVNAEHLRRMEYKVSELSDSIDGLISNMKITFAKFKKAFVNKKFMKAARFFVSGLKMWVQKTRLKKRMVKETVAVINLRSKLSIDDGFVNIEDGKFAGVNEGRRKPERDPRYRPDAGYYLDGSGKFQWDNYDQHDNRLKQWEGQQVRDNELVSNNEGTMQSAALKLEGLESRDFDYEEEMARQAQIAKEEDARGQVELEQLRQRMTASPETFAADMGNGDESITQKPTPTRTYADDFDFQNLPRKAVGRKRGKRRHTSPGSSMEARPSQMTEPVRGMGFSQSDVPETVEPDTAAMSATKPEDEARYVAPETLLSKQEDIDIASEQTGYSTNQVKMGKVVDTSYDTTHEDLAADEWEAPKSRKNRNKRR